MNDMSEDFLSRIDQAAAARLKKARELQAAEDQKNAEQVEHFERFKSLINEVTFPALRDIKSAIQKNGYMAEITSDYDRNTNINQNSEFVIRLQFTNDRKEFMSSNTSTLTIIRSPHRQDIRIFGRPAKFTGPADACELADLKLTELRDRDVIMDLATKFVSDVFES